MSIILLLLVGSSLLLSQVKNIPLAALMSLIISALITFLAYTNFYNLFLFELELFDIKWFFGTSFIFLSITFYVFLRFIEDVTKIIGSVVTFKPILLLLSLTSLVYGFINMIVF